QLNGWGMGAHVTSSLAFTVVRGFVTGAATPARGIDGPGESDRGPPYRRSATSGRDRQPAVGRREATRPFDDPTPPLFDGLRQGAGPLADFARAVGTLVGPRTRRHGTLGVSGLEPAGRRLPAMVLPLRLQGATTRTPGQISARSSGERSTLATPSPGPQSCGTDPAQLRSTDSSTTRSER